MLFSGLPRVLLMLKTSLKAVGEVLISNNSSKLLCLHHRMSCTNEQRNTETWKYYSLRQQIMSEVQLSVSGLS